MQLPATQLSSVAQRVAQAPQLAGSLRVFTHSGFPTKEQVIVPAGQAPALQVPPLQTSPVAQVFPQPPQENGLLDRSVQRGLPPAGEHRVSPGRQAQLPAEMPGKQAWSTPQVVPHVPQATGLS